LQTLDQSKTERLQAALQIKRKYKKLGVIAREIRNSGLQQEDTKWLQQLINHQKYCLANQFRVIAEASPVVEKKSKYTLGLSKNGDLKIKKTRVLVAINESDKE
jgi:glutamine phosphoribosylpyrophosphate amidotransferase